MKEELFDTVQEMMCNSLPATVFMATALLHDDVEDWHAYRVLKSKTEEAPIRVRVADDGEEEYVLAVSSEDEDYITMRRTLDVPLQFYTEEFDGEIIENGEPEEYGIDVLKRTWGVGNDYIDTFNQGEFTMTMDERGVSQVNVPIAIRLPAFEVTLHPSGFKMYFVYGRHFETMGIMRAASTTIPYEFALPDTNDVAKYKKKEYLAFELFEETLAEVVYLHMKQSGSDSNDPLFRWSGTHYPKRILNTEEAKRTVMMEVLREADLCAGAYADLIPFHDSRGEFMRWMKSGSEGKPDYDTPRDNVIANPRTFRTLGAPTTASLVLFERSENYHFIEGYMNAYMESLRSKLVRDPFFQAAVIKHAVELVHEFYHAAVMLTKDEEMFHKEFIKMFISAIGVRYGMYNDQDHSELAENMAVVSDPVGMLFDLAMSNADFVSQPVLHMDVIYLLKLLERSKLNVTLEEVQK